MSDYCTTLIVPGLHGSGEDHWQTWWKKQYRSACRIELEDWEKPDLDAWSKPILEVVRSSHRDVWIVGHSFGCLASLHVAQRYHPDRIAGLFLVAHADPNKFEIAERLPQRLEVPGIIVASQTDPWLEFSKARRWAAKLGSHFVSLGDAGHINAESGFGAWQQGFDLFRRFRREVNTSRFCGALI